MAPTSDERREVAARLRDEADGFRRLENELGQLTIDLGEVTAVFQDVAHFAGLDGTVRTCVLLDRIADLIDPTCEVMEVPDNDEFMVRVVSGFVCKRCGHEAIVERNCDGSAEPPRFCPHCGARVTSGGER